MEKEEKFITHENIKKEGNFCRNTHTHLSDDLMARRGRILLQGSK